MLIEEKDLMNSKEDDSQRISYDVYHRQEGMKRLLLKSLLE